MDLKHHGDKNNFGRKTIFGLRSFCNTSVQLNISAHKVKTKKIFEPKKKLTKKIFGPKNIFDPKNVFDTQKNQFLLFRALMVYFWGQDRVQNCSGAYSYSWTTFIFYSSFNSDFRSWLNFEDYAYLFLLYSLFGR